ncbi:MAG TPA: hypothetical protein VFW15_03220 [Thermoanaerobaculia bacterium]|jgi:hypothetical protein|nr:hypothetical protein [Thermoanaerobaculia bacterium]
MTPRRWIEYLAAILAGNALYFLVLFPDLPPALQHRAPTPDQTIPIHLDLGLLLDFVLCVVVYGVIRMASRHAQRWNERDFRLRQSLRDRQPRD